MTDETVVINCKVEYIRKKKDRNGRTYNDLKVWREECSDGVYIGRQGPVFVILEDGSKERYPKKSSIWANPFKITDKAKVDKMLCEEYGPYIVKKIKDENLFSELMKLDGKQLGCWCLPEHSCHGEVLQFLILYCKKFGNLDKINFNI